MFSLVLTSVGNGRRALVAKRYTMLICKGKHVDEYPVRKEKSNIKMLVRKESKFLEFTQGEGFARNTCEGVEIKEGDMSGGDSGSCAAERVRSTGRI